MLKKLLWSLFLGGMLLFSQPSFALAKFGHKIVCQLAFEHLPWAKQQRISQLLQAVPQEQQTIINHYNRLEKSTPLTFANACTWADAIKKHKKKHPRFKKFNRWHYLNVARNLDVITKAVCKKNCLPQAIITHQQQLKFSPISWQSAQALLFLGHWLGDIHQPLHVSYASDLGGNKVNLAKNKTPCKNLHGYWDACLIKKAKRSRKQWLAHLNAQWHKNHTPAYQAKQVWQWANESYQLVRTPAFQYCQLNSQNICLRPKGKIKLNDNYAQHYLPIMAQQLLKAAQRLNRILEVSL
ncbi:S1/P1 nuclease [Colwellia sp. TT2012]|uniref:S1/P1 nuclease n=1 Tax=Colwellia sp. TT2012 TaxID=1720342 RepID=UPI0007100D59|nr:S1/P1 nuclease [Colwellia sp. TT2012]